MSNKSLSSVNLPVHSSDPTGISPKAGDAYWNSTNGVVTVYDGAQWVQVAPESGVTDHGALTGLTDDDHTQYLLAAGTRSAAYLEIVGSAPQLLMTETDTGVDHRLTGDSSAGRLFLDVDYNSEGSTPYLGVRVKGVEMLRVSNTTVLINGSTAWHAGNDGAESGLDADTLDGQHGSVYAPPGMIAPYAGSTAPTGWLLCNGSAVSRTTYAALFAVCSTNYGSGDGSTTFNLPDLRGRVPVGLDNMGGSDAARLASTNTVGTAGGSATATAPHTHAIDHNHPAKTSGAGGNHTHTYVVGQGLIGAGYGAQLGSGYYAGSLVYGLVSGTTGGESSHTHSVDLDNLTGTSGASSVGATDGNMPPFLTIAYIIKT